MTERCQRCKEVDEDRRTLHMACFYDMSELGLPFKQITVQGEEGIPHKSFTLRVCKACRADWMRMITVWFVVPNSKTKSCGK